MRRRGIDHDLFKAPSEAQDPYKPKAQEHISAQAIPDSECPECGKSLEVRQGRYGMYIACSDYPECSWHQSPQAPKENDQTGITCPKCAKGKLVERTSRYGKHFYSCDRYPKCKYVLNDKPVAEPCPECDSPLLTEKKTASGMKIVCPNKDCRYSRESL